MTTSTTSSTTIFRDGDLAVATGPVLQKFHLLRLTSNRLEDCERAWETRLDGTDGMSERVLARHLRGYTDPAKLSEDQRRSWPEQWSGESLCGVENQKATYGDVTRYYWSARAIQPSDRCKKCWRRWRALGSPTIRGVTDAVEVEARPLPFGWRAVEPVGHPHDVPEGGDPTTVRNSADEVVGELRTEVLRWQRGDHYVRVCRLHEASYTHGVYYGRADRPLDDRHHYSSVETRATEKAHELMALGGFP